MPLAGAIGVPPGRRVTGQSTCFAKDQDMVLSWSRLKAALPVEPDRALE